MNNEIVFYYVVYTNPPYEKFNPFWINFLISLATVRFFYPKNKVVVITYKDDNPPKIAYELSNKMNYQIIQEDPIYNNLDNLRLNYKMFSRHVNCYNNAIKNKEKIIYLDSDIFLLKPFTNIRWDKIGIYTDNISQVNGGLIYMDSNSEAAERFVNFIDSELKDILDNKYDKMAYIKKAYPNCNENCSIQEETMFRNFVQRDREKFLETFYNFGYQNNGTVSSKKIKNEDSIKDLNNLHLIVDPPEKIPSIISKINSLCCILSSNHHIRHLMPEFEIKENKKIYLKFI